MWAKLEVDYEKLVIAIKNITSNHVENNINRIRLIFYFTLTSKWFHEILRLQPLMNIPFPHIGIIIDAYTTQCFKPKVLFEEAKIYWDGKNKIYGLKNEVAI
jgi:hypothetical protein